jgi:hypothetical protein
METKIKSLLNLLIVIALLLSVFGIASAACDTTTSIITLSRTAACANDTVIISLSRIVDCAKYVMNVTMDNKQLCAGVSGANEATCIFDVPPDAGVGEKTLTISIAGSTFEKNITIRARQPFTQCYGTRGEEVDCSQSCYVPPVEKRWLDVSAISLPMHFMFAMKSKSTENAAPSADIACNYTTFGLYPQSSLSCCQKEITCNCFTCEQDSSNLAWVWLDSLPADNAYKWVFGSPEGWSGFYQFGDFGNKGNSTTATYAPPNDLSADGKINASEYYNPNDINKSSGCYSGRSCGWEEHNITRYTYAWDFEYDTVVTAYSEEEYVPMYVGNDQQAFTEAGSPAAGEFSGACEGDSVCYTEVPFCGDGVCDTKSGERCWNCQEDCNRGPVPGKFKGDCTKDYPDGGCTLCPVTGLDADFADLRGCVIKYREEGKDCNCNAGMCGLSQFYDATLGGDGQRLKCIFRDTEGTSLTTGKCCHEDEVWDANYNLGSLGIDSNKDGIADSNDKGACVVPRTLAAYNLQVAVGQNPTDMPGFLASQCCGARQGFLKWGEPKVAWLKVAYTIANEGGHDETFTSNLWFESEVSGFSGDAGTTNPHQLHVTKDVDNLASLESIGGMNYKVACAQTSNALCVEGSYTSKINSSGMYVGVNPSETYPEVAVEIDMADVDRYQYKAHNHKYSSPIAIDELYCSTHGTDYFCDNGQQWQPKGQLTGSAFCGGYRTPEEVKKLFGLFNTNGWTPAFPTLGVFDWWDATPRTYCIPLWIFPLGLPVPIPSGFCFANCNYCEKSPCN